MHRRRQDGPGGRARRWAGASPSQGPVPGGRPFCLPVWLTQHHIGGLLVVFGQAVPDQHPVVAGIGHHQVLGTQEHPTRGVHPRHRRLRRRQRQPARRGAPSQSSGDQPPDKSTDGATRRAGGRVRSRCAARCIGSPGPHPDLTVVDSQRQLFELGARCRQALTGGGVEAESVPRAGQRCRRRRRVRRCPAVAPGGRTRCGKPRAVARC